MEGGENPDQTSFRKNQHWQVSRLALKGDTKVLGTSRGKILVSAAFLVKGEIQGDDESEDSENIPLWGWQCRWKKRIS